MAASGPRTRGAPLLNTLPGRAIVVGIAVKALIALARLAGAGLPSFIGVVDSVAGLAIAAGAAYFLVRLFVLAKRRLLWRVRRKLILSYIFIGFVPATLIVAFFLLCGLLLFFNFSSYLVQDQMRSLEEQARFLATSAALEIERGGGRDVTAILARRQAGAMPRFHGVSLAVVRFEGSCLPRTTTPGAEGRPRPLDPSPAAGPWAHVDAPVGLPGWIGCDGFAGLLAYANRPAPATPRGSADRAPSEISPPAADAEPASETHMVVRAAAFPDSATPGYAVVVDLPLDEEMTMRMRREIGVDVRRVSPVDVEGPGGPAVPLPGRAMIPFPQPAATEATGPLSWVTFLDYRDWTTGRTGTLLVSTQLSLGDVYQRIAAAPGLVGNRSFGQALLLVLLVVVGGLFLIIEGVALVAGFALAKSITGSVHELFTGTERVRQGDFTHKIAIKAEDQLGELASSFNQMTDSIEDLLRQAAEKKRLEEELRIAHEIQMSLLPQGPLRMPGASVTALCVPAREVGGDYYDLLPLGGRRFGVLIADVSGKGTSAALYMAELKGLVLSLSQIHSSPRDLLISANRIISEHLDARSFITMTYAVLDLDGRTMTYARAGHTPLIHVPGPGAESRRARILAPDGLVVGLKIDNGEMFEQLLEEETIPLSAGDLYLFFTDGISEAMNRSDDCFGEARLGQLLEDHAHLPSEELRERVLREIEAFVGGAPQHDDMTMILLRIEDLSSVTTIDREPVEVAERG